MAGATLWISMVPHPNPVAPTLRWVMSVYDHCRNHGRDQDYTKWYRLLGPHVADWLSEDVAVRSASKPLISHLQASHSIVIDRRLIVVVNSDFVLKYCELNIPAQIQAYSYMYRESRDMCRVHTKLSLLLNLSELTEVHGSSCTSSSFLPSLTPSFFTLGSKPIFFTSLSHQTSGTLPLDCLSYIDWHWWLSGHRFNAI